jgi:hypothetical protein
MTPVIVCAWHTRSHRHWAFALQATCELTGHEHDVIEVPEAPSGWEANTCQKARHLLAAMDKYPNRSIVFVDVDCEVKGDLSPLVDLPGDFGIHFIVKRRSNGARMRLRSGTLVVRPTPAARRLVEAWAVESALARTGWSASGAWPPVTKMTPTMMILASCTPAPAMT